MSSTLQDVEASIKKDSHVRLFLAVTCIPPTSRPGVLYPSSFIFHPHPPLLPIRRSHRSSSFLLESSSVTMGRQTTRKAEPPKIYVSHHLDLPSIFGNLSDCKTMLHPGSTSTAYMNYH